MGVNIEGIQPGVAKSYNGSEIVVSENNGIFAFNCVRLNGLAPMLSFGFLLGTSTMAYMLSPKTELITILLVLDTFAIFFLF